MVTTMECIVRKIVFSFATLFFCGVMVSSSMAQSVGINADGSAPNANAALDVTSPATGSGKGLLMPRVSVAQRTTADSGLAGGLLDDSGDLRGGAAQGLVVYQTDDVQGFYYNNSATATPSWAYLGSGTVTSVTAEVPLNGGTITSAGSISISAADASTDGYLSSEDYDRIDHSNAVYRWNVFSVRSRQYSCWYANDGNSPALFGGPAPSAWGGTTQTMADDLSSDKDVLRSLLTRKGYAGDNALVIADEWCQGNYTYDQAKYVVVLFRIENSTGGAINWTPCFYATGAGGSNFYEPSSMALNGVNMWAGGKIEPRYKFNTTISIPANRTSTVIFAVGSSESNTANGLRSLFLAFTDDCLDLPAGLRFVDDLDTATGGWDE